MTLTKTETQTDLLVIGGGINGCGIARDAAGRGLKVMLVEQSDLAQATSSASTKLFHGGLRYLEYYEFRLVREALKEREVLLRNMPHISWPLRFVLPHHKGLRPAWLLRLGLFLYDHLGGRKILPATKTLRLGRDPTGQPLKESYTKGFEYSDCWVEDSRLVVLNARDAVAHGAEVLTRTRCERALRENGVWTVTIRDLATDTTREVTTRGIVNAGGPWVDRILNGVMGSNSPARIRLVRGSHIVTRKLFEHDRAYIFQQSDGRIVFAIPYETDFTLIGTTDQEHEGDPSTAHCTEAEADYLRAAVSEYLTQPVTKEDIVWSYAGVRPLYDDGASSATKATRDYVLTLDEADGAPLLNVFGGKITTYRKLAEAAVAKIKPFFPDLTPTWTHDAPLPGGDFPVEGIEGLAASLRGAFPFIGARNALRLVRAYGTEAQAMLGDAQSKADLGQDFGAGLYEREVQWLVDREWARTADDIIWRRTKLGLRLTPDQVAALDGWLARQPALRAAE